MDQANAYVRIAYGIKCSKMSDTAILLTIITVFVFLGAILPFINEAFGQDGTSLNTAGIEFATGQGFDDENEVSIGKIAVSIFTMFFWTFGSIPALLDLLLFVPLRIIFVVLLFKLIRGVGG